MRPSPDTRSADPRQIIADLRRELAARTAERDEALAQQAASAEVLQKINDSPGDLTPVFDAMLERALTLCGASLGMLYRFDGAAIHPLAVRSTSEMPAELRTLSVPIEPGSSIGRLARGEGDLIHIADVTEDEFTRSGAASRRKFVELTSVRTALFVALRKDRALVGVFVIYRQEVRPFSEKQIALLENFADQAVIAMENARLITETRESLEQQQAMAEVLQVINASPSDLAPVFDVMLDKAMRLCGAAFGELHTVDGQQLKAVALRGVPPAHAEYRRSHPSPATPGTVTGRLFAGMDVVEIADLQAEEAYRSGEPQRRAVVDLGGARSAIAVALRQGRTLLGGFFVYRQEVRPFSDKQIALLQNFAAQAVIAMENARLITETREALEQQTATAEVLGVINSSPGDLRPVFRAILEKAHSLCDAPCGSLQVYDGDLFRAVATRGLAEPFDTMLRQGYRPDASELRRQILSPDRGVIQVADFRDVLRSSPDDPVIRGVVEIARLRTVLLIPLRRDGVFLGRIVAARQEVRPFTEKQIALLENFAAQAVIAMENARLLGELRQRTRDLEESLEYQTATSDVLKVISRSTFDLQPVLDAVCQTASQLCAADGAGITMREGEGYRYVSTYSVEKEFFSFLKQQVLPLNRGSIAGRTALEGKIVHIPDIAADPEYALPQTLALGKLRTLLGAPLLRDGTVIGTLTLTRQRVEPFTERQIELVRTFADQAVIAIENTRLLTETREALEQQTATAEILQVINRSPGDLAPVFGAMLDKAMQLCAAVFGYLMAYDDERFAVMAHRGLPPSFARYLQQMHQPGNSGAYARIKAGAPFVHIADLKEGEVYQTSPLRQALVNLGGARSGIILALRKDETLLGVLTFYRQEVRPFSEKQIALLQSFAAQAVIAMDNARLLDEIRQRQAELRVTFDNMGDGVAMFDAELRLAAWNRNFQQMLDLSDEFLTTRPSFSQYFQYLRERGEFSSADLEAELSRGVEDTEEEMRFERTRPDGRVIEVRRNAVPGGGFVLIYGDVTERKRAEEEIRAARDAAEKALGELRTAQTGLLHAQKMAALGQLTAGIAHEIKNPLNFVNNFAGLSVELLEDLKAAAAPAIEALADDRRADLDETVEMLTQNLEKIAEHGQRADGIVKSMLLHSRGGSGEWQSVNLNALIEEALNLAYHGARAQDQTFNITMERDLDRDLKPVEVVPQDITRVFLNLFGNGFYAAAKRGRDDDGAFRPLLTVTTRDLGEEVEIRVRDNGIGIPSQYRDKLFQPFFTTKPTGEGTGLGLSISYDIVTQQHGGTIAVESEEDAFTEFTIRLPRRPQGRTPEGTA